MKSFLFILFSAFIVMAVYTYNNPTVNFKEDAKEGIQFHKGTWDEALKLAKFENKIIFLNIYATWCGPCKRLKINTFSNIEVGSFYNKNFINITTDGEQEDGAILAKKYGITGYPALLFINRNGEVIAQTGGYYKPKELIEIGKNFVTK
jgi:thioredoxin 1